MKKIIGLLVIIASLMVSSSALAATVEPKTVKEMKTEIATQQKVYDEQTELASFYLNEIITKKMTWDDMMAYNDKLEASRKAYKAAAARMLEMKKKIWDIEQQ